MRVRWIWMLTVAGVLAFAACNGDVLDLGVSLRDAGSGDASPVKASPVNGTSGAPGATDAGSHPPGATDAQPGTPGATDAGSDPPGAIDASPPPPFDAASLPQGPAFTFVVNGVVQSPMACPSDNWEFPPYPTLPAGQDSGCSEDPYHPGCGGVTSVHLANTGAVPLAYYARALWGGGYVPGVMTGQGPELAGVLDPGAAVEITQVFTRGIVAILGRSEPFSAGTKYVFDEGTMPWPAGVPGSGGATVMHLAQVDVYDSCTKISPQW